LKKVIIVGAGPAGLFAANEITEKLDVTVIDKRNYIGGAGLNSDGKLIFHPEIGGNLKDFLSIREANNIIKKIDETFEKCGFVDDFKCEEDKLRKLEIEASKVGIRFIPSTQKHIGTDKLPKVMNNLKNNLEKRGVKFRLSEEVKDIKIEKSKVIGIETNKEFLNCDAILLAVGRSGNSWLKRICDKFGIKYKFNPVDIGVRVEVLSEVMEEITSLVWDPKFHIRTKTYDDFVRTFCVCSNGFITTENYENSIFGVNGHSFSNKKSRNTNFALLVRVALTEPLEDTTTYGELIANQTNILGGGKPIIQRLGDLKSGRRSTWERIDRSHVKPTLKKVTPGNISMAYPHRIVQDILEALEMLNLIIPGVNSDSTLLYAPEIKFYARRIETNKNLQTKIKNLFVAGDGAGVSRGIVGSAATGIIAGRGILKYLIRRFL